MNIQVASNIIQNIAVIVASLIAIHGINSWRREIKWKRKFELAEETLSLFYDVRDRIEIIRSAFSHPEEGINRPKAEDETEAEKQLYDSAYVPFERYNNNKEPFQKLFTIKYRFMAVFGTEYVHPFNEVQKIINDILNAARILATHYWKKQGKYFNSDEEFNRHLKNMELYESKIWFSGETDDIISNRINTAISKIEDVFLKIKGASNRANDGKFYNKN